MSTTFPSVRVSAVQAGARVEPMDKFEKQLRHVIECNLQIRGAAVSVRLVLPQYDQMLLRQAVGEDVPAVMQELARRLNEDSYCA